MAEELKKVQEGPSKSAPMAAKMLATDAPDKSAPKEAKQPKAAKAGAAPSKKRHKHTHIEHHYDESGKETGHTVRHSGDASGETSYSAQDLDGVHDGLEQHVGEPNADEGQPQMADASQPQGGGAPQGASQGMPQGAPQGGQPQGA